MTQLYLCSFSSSDLKKSINRYLFQAKQMSIYKDIKVYKEIDLPKKIREQIKDFNLKKKRLYGYGCWKAFIIKNYLKSLPKNSIIQYSDIGCHFNTSGKKRLLEYVEMCKTKNILGFQYYEPNFKSFKHFTYQNYLEKDYTKIEVLKYLNLHDNLDITDTPQFLSGIIFFKNNDISLNLLDEWEKLSSIDNLIDDSLSEENCQSFKEHRHDQSLFSILCKTNKISGLSASECEWAEYRNRRTWEHLKEFPILAKRDKRYGLVTRFLNRQKKNISRIIDCLK